MEGYCECTKYLAQYTQLCKQNASDNNWYAIEKNICEISNPIQNPSFKSKGKLLQDSKKICITTNSFLQIENQMFIFLEYAKYLLRCTHKKLSFLHMTI